MRFLDLILTPEAQISLRDSFLSATEDTLVFCRQKGRAVFIGGRTNATDWVNVDFCQANDIPILRMLHRPGRGSGYHDEGEFRIAAVVTNKGDLIIPDMKTGQSRLGEVIETALGQLNIPALCEGNNILIEDKKIGALNVTKYRGFTFINMKVLMSWDIDTAEQAIISQKHNMRDHVRSLEQLGWGVTFDQLKGAFINALQEKLGINLEQFDELTEDERERASKLGEMYASESWQKYGKWSPVKDYWRPE